MKKNDPAVPLPAEAGYYLHGEPAFAIRLYAARLQCSEVTAEDAIRKHVQDLGFKTIPPVYLPRVN